MSFGKRRARQIRESICVDMPRRCMDAGLLQGENEFVGLAFFDIDLRERVGKTELLRSSAPNVQGGRTGKADGQKACFAMIVAADIFDGLPARQNRRASTRKSLPASSARCAWVPIEEKDPARFPSRGSAGRAAVAGCPAAPRPS